MDEQARHELTSRVLSADSRFFGALLNADREALDAVLAPDFVMVEVNAGAVVSRADFIELTSSGEVRFNAIESFNDEAIVRFYGPTAVLVSRTAMRFTLPDGSSLSLGSRYTHVFVSSDDSDWRLASAQGTQIADTDAPDR